MTGSGLIGCSTGSSTPPPPQTSVPPLVEPLPSVQGVSVTVSVVTGTHGWPDASLPSVSNDEHSTHGFPFASLPSVSAAEHSMILQSSVPVDELESVLVEPDEPLDEDVSHVTGGGTESPLPP
jgi:hypothetical protein